MSLQRIPHYLRKIIQLGPRRTIEVVRQRTRTYLSAAYVRRQAYMHQAHHTWSTIGERHKIRYSFTHFFMQRKNMTLFSIDLLYPPLTTLEQADQFVQKTFDLLGSGPCTFQKIPWHDDFRLHQQDATADCSFDAKAFYKDIVVHAGTNSALVKDIKVPWELSRFAHLLVLGKAYQQTNDEKYAQAFSEQIADWLDENPYLLGPNWVCPMDVGLRAINWVIAFTYFKHSTSIDETLWERFTCSLYDHFVYLENNWEVYDSRTSNHYLSDLVGYLYLCYIFQDLAGIHEKTIWCYQEILKEADKQIFEEGSDYEGSTRYHILVTELFYHAYLMFGELQLSIPASFKKKIERMFTFIDVTSSLNIGDNDSGTVLYFGITNNIIKKMTESRKDASVAHFQSFGLSWMYAGSFEVSLRHHAYQEYQPSGHFHNDASSITLVVDGNPVLVDPGSYVYTPSAVWRNYFRSATNHNTFFVEGHEPIPFDDRLFGLAIPPLSSHSSVSSTTLETCHDNYTRFGLTAHRQVKIDEQQERVVITDWWEHRSTRTDLLSSWNFTFSSEIIVEYLDPHWLILVGNKPYLKISSSELTFSLFDGWVSSEYGSKQSCKQLKASRPMNDKGRTMIIFEKV